MENTTIGFRVTPKEIYYSIVEESSDTYEFISISSLKVPVSLDAPEQLSYIRNAVSTIITQYNIQYAGIKLIEGNARASINNALIFRFNIEGVLMELFSDSTIRHYFLGVTSNISSVLSIKKEKAQDMLGQLLNLDSLLRDNNKKITSDDKESMLVALASLEVGKNNE